MDTKNDPKWCRRRYILLINRKKSKAVILDNFVKRYEKLRSRVSEWSLIMDMLREEFPCRLVMITLTIHKIKDYSPGMIRDYVKKLKRQLGNNLYGFAWVAEMQKRGAVHYHLCLCMKKYTRVKTPDTSGMWEWGSSNIITARTAYYLCKYIGKERQKDLSRYPKSCRVYSVSYRLPEGAVKRFYDNNRNDKKAQLEIIEAKKNKKDLWEFIGATVTKGYAEKVLKPLDMDLTE